MPGPTQNPPRPKRNIPWGKVMGAAGEILRAVGEGNAPDAKNPPGPGVKQDPDLAEDFIGAVDENTQAIRALTKAVKSLTKAVNENTEAQFDDEEDEQ